MTEQVIARRKALKYLGLLTSTAVGREFLAEWIPSTSASPISNSARMQGLHHSPPPAVNADHLYTAQFFKPEEFETVEILTEMIIPTDDKPGAREAQVARYIDLVVFSAAEHQPSLQTRWIEGLTRLEDASREKFNRGFRQISPSEQQTLLMEISLPERDPKASHPAFDFYRLVKEMTVEGFYTSRVGLIDVLKYQGLSFLSEFLGCTHPEHQS